MAEGGSEAGGLEEVWAGLIRSRPLLRRLLEFYVLKSSPMVRSYVKSVSRVTGLPEAVVERSEPVRNYVRRILGI